MKQLIILSGLPGSGKSTYIAKHFKRAKVVASDEIRLSITGSYKVMAPNMQVVYDEMIRRTNELLANNKNIVVALDSTFLDDQRRNYFLDKISGQDKTRLIMLRARSLDAVLARNLTRNPDKHVPEDTIKEMASRYKEPADEFKGRYTSIETVWID